MFTKQLLQQVVFVLFFAGHGYIHANPLVAQEPANSGGAEEVQSEEESIDWDYGYDLYRAAFRKIRDGHVALNDPDKRRAWSKEWKKKYDDDGTLDWVEGADYAILTMLGSLKGKYDYYLFPLGFDEVEEGDDEDEKSDSDKKSDKDEKKPVVFVKSNDLGKGVKYVYLKEFDNDCEKQLLDALKEASSGKALVLDLRGNPGGKLYLANKLLDWLCPQGVAYKTRERRGDRFRVKVRSYVGGYRIVESFVETSDGGKGKSEFKRKAMTPVVPLSMPMVVLIDEDSASCSELVAGALQSCGRARLVGKPSFGKGIGQSYHCPLDDEERILKMSDFQFIPGGEKPIHGIGLVPDVEEHHCWLCENDYQLRAATRLLRKAMKRSDSRAEQREELRVAKKAR